MRSGSLWFQDTYDKRSNVSWTYDGMSIAFAEVQLPWCFQSHPTDAEIHAIIIGWHAGYEAGKIAGKAMLRQEIKNLIG